MLTSVKQIVNNKKFNFKIGLKGRPEVYSLLKERKLIQQKTQVETTVQKLKLVNILLEFFLRITLQAESATKQLILNNKLGSEFTMFTHFVFNSGEPPCGEATAVTLQYLALYLKLMFLIVS